MREEVEYLTFSRFFIEMKKFLKNFSRPKICLYQGF